MNTTKYHSGVSTIAFDFSPCIGFRFSGDFMVGIAINLDVAHVLFNID